MRAVLEGVNVSIFNYGATGSGKTHTMEGKNDEKGLVYLVTQQIFKMLEEKRYTNPTYHFEARIRFLEIFDETVHDLLQPGAGMAYNKNNVKIQEWEGNSVQGVSWIPVSTHTQLNDFFLSGPQNKNKRSNEFGLMADKSSQLFQLELRQSISDGLEKSILVSRMNYLSLPGCEILNEDPEALRIKEGPDLNKGMISMSNLMRDLAPNPLGDYVNYDDSILTSLSKDIFGGNSITVGIFTLQYGDHIGSVLTMRALKRAQSIMNFPIQNDNKALGLLRKLRVEIKGLQQLAKVSVSGGGGFDPAKDNYEQRIAEL